MLRKLVVVSCVFLVFIAGIVLLKIYIERNLPVKLKSALYVASKGKYVMLFDDVSIGYFPPSLGISNLRISSVSQDSSGSNLEFSTNKLEFHDVELLQLFIKKRLIVQKIVTVNPYVKMSSTLSDSVKEHTAKGKLDIDSIFIGRIELLKSTIHFNSPGLDSVNFKYNRGDIYIDNLSFHLAAEREKINYDIGSAVAVFSSIKWNSGKFYNTSASRLFISFTTKTVELDSLYCTPLYGKKEFALKTGHQTDRFDVFVPAIVLKNVDIDSFLKRNSISADSCIVNGAMLNAFRDKNFIRRIAYVPSLQEVLSDSGLVTRINVIALKNFKVTYEELESNRLKSGKVELSDGNCNIYNFCSGIKSSDTIKLQMSSKFMGAKMTSNWSFPMSSKKVNFTVNGTFLNFDLTGLNRITRTNAGLNIKSGYLKKMSFNIVADHNYARGNVHMVYNNLEVALEPGMVAQPLDGIAEFAINRWVIHKSNPDQSLLLRNGRVSYPNNPQRFFINYGWKAMLSGIKDIITIKR